MSVMTAAWVAAVMPLALALSLPTLPALDADLRPSHGFSAAANWLIPGRVLLGANPTKGRGSSLERVASICEEGCRTFVSLQEEAEERDAGYEADARAAAVGGDDLQFVRYPIQDLRPAKDLAYLEEIVDSLADRVRRGENIYMHCFAGRGRTGLVAACLLGTLYDLDADEALDRIGTYYSLRASYGIAGSRAADGYSPETVPQRDQVRDFLAARKPKSADVVPFDGLSCAAFKLDKLATTTPRSLGGWEPPGTWETPPDANN